MIQNLQLRLVGYFIRFIKTIRIVSSCSMQMFPVEKGDLPARRTQQLLSLDLHYACNEANFETEVTRSALTAWLSS